MDRSVGDAAAMRSVATITIATCYQWRLENGGLLYEKHFWCTPLVYS